MGIYMGYVESGKLREKKKLPILRKNIGEKINERLDS